MKVKYHQLLNSVTPSAQGSVLQRFNALPVKISAAIRLKLVFRNVDMCLEVFHEKRNELIEKHGEKNADGNYEVKDAHLNEAFQKEHQELVNCEVDVLGERFTLLDLFTAVAIANDQIMISMADLNALSWLIDAGTDEESDAETAQPSPTEGDDNILELGDAKAASA